MSFFQPIIALLLFVFVRCIDLAFEPYARPRASVLFAVLYVIIAFVALVDLILILIAH